MTVLVILIPVSLVLGGLGLAAFLWALRSNQYDDPEGHAARILSDRYDDRPAEDEGMIGKSGAGLPVQKWCPRSDTT